MLCGIFRGTHIVYSALKLYFNGNNCIFFPFDYEIVISVFWAVDQMYGQTKIFSVEYIVTFLWDY